MTAGLTRKTLESAGSKIDFELSCSGDQKPSLVRGSECIDSLEHVPYHIINENTGGSDDKSIEKELRAHETGEDMFIE